MSRNKKTAAQKKREAQKRDALARKVYLGQAKPKPEKFEPVYDGYFKIFLHDDDYKRAADRAEFTEDWQANQKRGEIMRRERKFQVALHIFDTDGDKRGHTVMGFKVKGGQRALSKVIFGFGNDFVDEMRAGDEALKVDLINSYAVVRA
ncbi:hypothetical protein [Psychrobacter sp.]|uniref:hypothetical protein n=1 Tax=Psychrobacter sp. TaxID=56811 RepID=UPI003562858E